MSKSLDDLSPRFQPKAFELLARLMIANIPVIVVDTLRTQEEQEAYIRAGVSWTAKSKHLIGEAIDLVPRSVVQYKGWSPWHPDWEKLGAIGEAIGLVWGGRWRQRDLGHFEIKED